jgi:hypothetical protein
LFQDGKKWGAYNTFIFPFFINLENNKRLMLSLVAYFDMLSAGIESYGRFGVPISNPPLSQSRGSV